MMGSPKKQDSAKHFLNIVPVENNTSRVFLDDKELFGVSKVDFMMNKDTGELERLGIVFDKIGYKIEGDM